MAKNYLLAEVMTSLEKDMPIALSADLNGILKMVMCTLIRLFRKGGEPYERELMKNIKITVEKADSMKEGFAAYRIGSLREGDPVILLNVFATLAVCLEEDISIKEQIIENLMHEFGHVMEEFLDKEFDENFIEGVVMSYREKYGGKKLESLKKK